MRDIPVSRRHNQGREGGSHKQAAGRADATLPSKQSEAKAALSMYSQAKHGPLLIKAGQVGYMRASQLTAVSLPLLSELSYPRVAANLKR